MVSPKVDIFFSLPNESVFNCITLLNDDSNLG